MSSQYRTVAAGLGVGAICLVMASLKWQHLLMFFALAGVSWAIWWFRSTSKPAQAPMPQPRRAMSRRNRPEKDNIYAFPAAGWNVSDATGS